ncbi:MAG: endonuclease III domain-containing protein [Desulfonauticus sp.]|nr:endonuclease III domain-containing protein [Desulfonauticus sp.]
MNKKATLLDIYKLLLQNLGPSNWWPGDSPFEIAVGAILTQNTNWHNVEKAINNLKQANLLTEEAIFQIDEQTLASHIKPSGFFNIKAKRLKNFVTWLYQEANLNLLNLQNYPLETLRPKLLAVSGIGPETADSILLYALNKPIFVVDVYTKRMFFRHGLIPEETTYSEVQELFMDNLEPNVKMFNEFHALIVRACKKWCTKKNPKCEQCPLKNLTA